jgi:hypothetical protein
LISETVRWEIGLGTVAHTYNPSYSGRRDQEGWFKASPDKQFTRPYLENAQHKKGLAEWLKW